MLIILTIQIVVDAVVEGDPVRCFLVFGQALLAVPQFDQRVAQRLAGLLPELIVVAAGLLIGFPYHGVEQGEEVLLAFGFDVEEDVQGNHEGASGIGVNECEGSAAIGAVYPWRPFYEALLFVKSEI